MKKKTKRILLTPIAILALLLFAFFLWTLNFYKPSSEATAVFNEKSNVEVSKDTYITFTPKDTKTEIGLIFYPGGKVAPEAYAPLCRKIAENGIKVVIVPMPFKLAIFGKNKADAVMAKYPEIKYWGIGGHSLGGVMAADYAYENKQKIKALILLASYPQDKSNMSNSKIKVLSLYGSKDKVADISKVKAASKLLPQDAIIEPIDGGNHGQFGSYGYQKGDGKASISEIQQQSIASNYVSQFLKSLK